MNELWEEALDLLSVPDREENQKEATAWIEDVIKRFQFHLESCETSPTLKDLGDQLEQISTRARELAQLLEINWPYAQAAAAGYCSVDDWYNQDGFVFIEHMFEAPEKGCASLPKIAEAADRIRSRLPPPRGGERSLEKRFQGLPKAALAIHCWELFHHFRPGEAKTTQGSDFHRFTSIIYEMASGKDPDLPGVGLDHYVKYAAIVCRKLIERKPVLERLWGALPPGHSPVGLLGETTAIKDWFGIPRQMDREIFEGKK